MPTDPARIKLTDAGNPQKCPVWQLHEVYSDASVRDFVVDGCTGAKIGCVECKKPIIESINNELAPIAEKVTQYSQDDDLINQIIFEGSNKARETAKVAIEEVRDAMGL
jgi:tryptophanyl-tRNA synthetase